MRRSPLTKHAFLLLVLAALVLSRLFAVVPLALLAVVTTPAAAFADALEGQALRDALQLRGVAVAGR